MKRKTVKAAFRHEEIAEQLAADIRAGTYPVGSQLPPELKLCEALQASRHTVRQALAAVAERGLIVRRASTGSIVVARHEPRILVHTTEPMARSLSGPSDLVRTTISAEHVVVNAELASFLECKVGSKWFRIERMNFSKETDEVISFAQIYILPIYAGITSHPEHERTRISDQIVEMFDEVIEKVEVEVVAGPLGPIQASRLSKPLGSGGLAVLQRYTGRSQKIFEMSATYHPSDKKVFLVELQRPQNVNLSGKR
jgi:GntR family transcriptional regulator